MPGGQASSLGLSDRGVAGGLSCSSSPQALLPSAKLLQSSPLSGLPVGASSKGPQRSVHGERRRHGHVCTRRPRRALCPLLQNCKVFGKGQVLPGCSHTEGQGSGAEANRWPFQRSLPHSQSSVHTGDVPGLPSH